MDVPLSREGERQGHDAARFLTNKPLEKVIASDLLRTHTTGQFVAEANFVPLELTRSLRDWNVGQYCGLLVKDVIEDLHWLVDHPEQKAPGGESFGEYLKRFRTAFAKLLAYTRENADRPIAVVTHSRNFGAAHAYLTGDTAIYKAPHSLPPGGIMAFKYDDSQGWQEVVAWPGDEANSPGPQDHEEN